MFANRMKSISLFLFSFAILLASAEARTWTSSDGSRTFEGELRKFDESTGVVTVLVNGRPLEFTEDKLSEADRAFLKEHAASGGASADSASMPDTESVVGEKLAKAKLHQLDGRRFRRVEWDKAPEYYLFYYSASW